MKKVPLPNTSASIEIFNTQSSITSNNEISEPSEEERIDFDKISNTIIDAQTPTLQNSHHTKIYGHHQISKMIGCNFLF